MIELRGVCQKFRVGNSLRVALNEISLSIAQGEIVSLMGPSGSGKSTLLNIIGGLLTPTKGSVLINGQEISELSDRQRSLLRSRTIGFVFQHFNLIPVLSAFKNVEYPLLLLGTKAAQRRQMVDSILEQVGLKHFVHYMPSHLSGGQQQRVAIARAIVSKPQIVICDEPTANLDTATANEIIDLMLQLNKELSATLLFSTHDNKIKSISNCVYRLCDGGVAS